jgi:hypothetical protein
MEKVVRQKMVYVPKNKISYFPIFDTLVFEQSEEESLKDAWYRIKAMYIAETNPCIEARLLMNNFFWLHRLGEACFRY